MVPVRTLPAVADFFVGLARFTRNGIPGDAFAIAAAFGAYGREKDQDERENCGDEHDVLTIGIWE